MKVLAKWSVEDYHKMIAAGIISDRRVELIEGEIIEVSPEGPAHSSSCDRIAEYLREKLRGIAKVREAHPITLNTSEPEPDIAIVRLRKSNYSDRHPYPEDIYWLIEIADSTITKDKQIKKKIYATAGIQEYWIIDRNDRQLIIYLSPDGEDYRQEIELDRGIINPLAFPAIAIEVEKLLG